MNRDNKKGKIQFNGADWGAYTHFEFSWADILLEQNTLSREALIYLAKKFNLSFPKKNWEQTLSSKDIGIPLLCDIPKENLLPALQEALDKFHPDLLSFKEAQKIYEDLSKLDIKILAEFCKSISFNKNLVKIIDEGLGGINFDFRKEDILFFILENLYKIPKEIAKEKVNNLLKTM
jgi:hypothetical protein